MNNEWATTLGDDFLDLLNEAGKIEEKNFQEKFLKKTNITDIAIKKIPFISYPDLTTEQAV